MSKLEIFSEILTDDEETEDKNTPYKIVPNSFPFMSEYFSLFADIKKFFPFSIFKDKKDNVLKEKNNQIDPDGNCRNINLIFL